MKVTMLDLRFKTKKILKALNNNEEIRLFYRGKETGLILPVRGMKFMSTEAHPFFGSAPRSASAVSVSTAVRRLRSPRYAF